MADSYDPNSLPISPEEMANRSDLSLPEPAEAPGFIEQPVYTLPLSLIHI